MFKVTNITVVARDEKTMHARAFSNAAFPKYIVLQSIKKQSITRKDKMMRHGSMYILLVF